MVGARVRGSDWVSVRVNLRGRCEVREGSGLGFQ